MFLARDMSQTHHFRFQDTQCPHCGSQGSSMSPGNRSGIRASWSRWTWRQITWWFVKTKRLDIPHLSAGSDRVLFLTPWTLSNSRWHKASGDGARRQSFRLSTNCSYHCGPIRSWPRIISFSYISSAETMDSWARHLLNQAHLETEQTVILRY